MQDIIKKIKEIYLSMNKKEDDLKNIINEKDIIINEMNNKINELFTVINEQKEEILFLKNNIKELNEHKNIMDYLLKNYISNLDSLIIDNNNYNSTLKNWIDPNSNIKANLLYRLSRDGPEISTFHKLCDNKGPTLNLFHLKMGEKIGFFIKDSYDSISGWKNEPNTFIFNLNQNQKYNKNTFSINPTYYCISNCGPSANGLGCNPDVNLNYIYHSADVIDNIFINGTKLLPSENIEKEYEVIECEIFQIII